MAHVHYIEWHIHPFRADRWLEAWTPALERALAFGAGSCFLTRNIDDRLHFRQVSTWEDKEDFDRYWYSDEISALRQEAFSYYNKPLATAWHSLADTASRGIASTESTEDETAETPA
jgi:hypothetical protein